MSESENQVNEGEKPQEETAITTIDCPSCKCSQKIENKFCEKCGQNFASEKIKSQKKIRRDLKSGNSSREKRKHFADINDARIFILVISIVTFGLYLFQLTFIEPVIYRFIGEPEDENTRNIIKMVSYIPLGLALVYLSLFFWSFKNTFAAILTTLAIYIIETGIVICFGPILPPLYLFYKIVVCCFQC